MKPIKPFDRVLLLLAAGLAAYQVMIGIDDLDAVPILAFTIAFGAILVATLLLIILGYEGLGSTWVVILATIIPLGLAGGLVAEYLKDGLSGFTIFGLAGLAGVILTRLSFPGRPASLWLACVHAVAGLAIVLLPILLVLDGRVNGGFLLVSLGGSLISLLGVLLFFSSRSKKASEDRPDLARIFAPVFCFTNLALVAGFGLA